MTDGVTTMQHQHGGEPPGVVFVLCFMDPFLHEASFSSGYWCYARHWLSPAGDLGYSAIELIA